MTVIPNPQWEYRVDDFGGPLRAAQKEEVQERLNAWGEDGWEVVSAVPLEGSMRIRVIAKRPLSRIVRRKFGRPGLDANVG